MASYHAGWHFASLKAQNGETRFTLDTDRPGISAVRVSLLPRCDLEGATAIASDEPGMRRFERIISVVNDFKAARSYVFHGGSSPIGSTSTARVGPRSRGVGGHRLHRPERS